MSVLFTMELHLLFLCREKEVLQERICLQRRRWEHQVYPPSPSLTRIHHFLSLLLYVHRMHLQESWSDTGNPTHSLFPLPLSPPSSPPISPFPPFPTFLSSFSSLPTSPPSFPEGYGVMLDHRHLRTPLRRKFVIPSEPLALAVAQEWNAQGTFVQPQLMHLVSESVLFPDCCRTRLAL